MWYFIARIDMIYITYYICDILYPWSTCKYMWYIKLNVPIVRTILSMIILH